MIKSPPKVMTFSATDPTSGAGLQADILTISSLGCHPVSIATGFTVQDTIGVNKLIPVDSELVNDQARFILKDMEVEITEFFFLDEIISTQFIMFQVDSFYGYGGGLHYIAENDAAKSGHTYSSKGFAFLACLKSIG